MEHVIEKATTTSKQPERPLLFVVWIDTTCGLDASGPEWEMNSAHLCPAKPIQDALDEAAECQASGFPTKIMPEGQTPRGDGLFSDPKTDPEA